MNGVKNPDPFTFPREGKAPSEPIRKRDRLERSLTLPNGTNQEK